ncbi:MAG TPA: universal stress protein [Nocardioides sp.]|nr:universal stress protein [Nocardioides sp.]
MGDQGGAIVVGVDGSSGAAAALSFALTEGSKRGCTVEVVTAWLGSSQLEGTPESDDLADGRARVHHMQGDVVARCLEEREDVPDILRVVVHDYAGRVLVARADKASMVIVGSGSPSSASHQVLGSVAEYCVRHSPVPVVIVPAPARLERRAAANTAAAG